MSTREEAGESFDFGEAQVASSLAEKSDKLNKSRLSNDEEGERFEEEPTGLTP